MGMLDFTTKPLVLYISHATVNDIMNPAIVHTTNYYNPLQDIMESSLQLELVTGYGDWMVEQSPCVAYLKIYQAVRHCTVINEKEYT